MAIEFEHIRRARDYEKAPWMIPESPGVYKWYIDEYYAEKLLNSRYVHPLSSNRTNYFTGLRNGMRYVEYPPEGRYPAKYYGIYVGMTEDSLRERIVDEHMGGSGTSPLRQDIAFLLSGDPSNREGTDWILDYLLVGYHEDETYRKGSNKEKEWLGKLEEDAINACIVPLNRKKNNNAEKYPLLKDFLRGLPKLD